VVWRTLDPQAREATRNPHWVLQAASGRRLEELASDAAFGRALRQLVLARRAYLLAPTWCAQLHPERARQRIAYFSMEQETSSCAELAELLLSVSACSSTAGWI
jgi:hypothetical protein